MKTVTAWAVCFRVYCLWNLLNFVWIAENSYCWTCCFHQINIFEVAKPKIYCLAYIKLRRSPFWIFSHSFKLFFTGTMTKIYSKYYSYLRLFKERILPLRHWEWLDITTKNLNFCLCFEFPLSANFDFFFHFVLNR